MPKWCDNYIVLNNNDHLEIDNLAYVLQQNVNSSYDNGSVTGVCQYFRPMPTIHNNPHDQYSWRIHNWGIQSDIFVQSFEIIDNYHISFHFISHCNSPIQLYHYLSHLGWHFFAYFHEPSIHLIGLFDNQPFSEFNGEFSTHYDFNDKNWIFKIPPDLIDFGMLHKYYQDFLSYK